MACLSARAASALFLVEQRCRDAWPRRSAFAQRSARARSRSRKSASASGLSEKLNRGPLGARKSETCGVERFRRWRAFRPERGASERSGGSDDVLRWNLWAYRDAGASDLGSVGSEAAAREAAERANGHQRERGLTTLGVRFEAQPDGWEPPGYGCVPTEASRDARWPPKPRLYWRSEAVLPLHLREGKTERRDRRLAPELEAAERARRSAAAAPVASVPRGAVPSGLRELTSALSGSVQRVRRS